MPRVSDGAVVPDGAPLLIGTLWAYVAFDEADHTEGVIAWQRPDGVWMPMVGADLEMADALRTRARAIAKLSGTKVSLVHFTDRHVVVDDIRKDSDA